MIALALAALWPDAALAQTLGSIVCNLRQNFAPMAPLINTIAFTIGGVLAFKGAMLLKKHAEGPKETPVVAGIAHVLVGGALGSLPVVAGTLQETIHSWDGAPNGGNGCTPGPITGSVTSLDKMMENFVNNIAQPMYITLSTLCFVIGLFLIVKGLIRASKSGTDPREAAPHRIMVSMLIGAVLISISAVATNMINTLFESPVITDFSNLINWSKITGETNANTEAVDLTVKAILMFVQVIGFIAFIRGWLIIKNAVEGAGQATVPQGLTHIIGGTMAINIGTMIQLFDATFGTGIVNT